MSESTKGTVEPLCPYCGQAHPDAWEWELEEGEAECSACGREYGYAREVVVTYSTVTIREVVEQEIKYVEDALAQAPEFDREVWRRSLNYWLSRKADLIERGHWGNL